MVWHLPDDYIFDLEEKFKALPKIRERAGWSQSQLADLLGVHQSRVSRWEKGQEYPEFTTLVPLCRWLDAVMLDTTLPNKKYSLPDTQSL